MKNKCVGKKNIFFVPQISFKKNPFSISNMFFPCLSLYTIAIANLSNDNQQQLD